MKSSHNYKVLYEDCARQSARKDRLISLLESQVMELVRQKESLGQTVLDQDVQMKEQQELLSHQQQTILGQAEKLSQQQSIIAGQQEEMAGQKKQLDKKNVSVRRTHV